MQFTDNLDQELNKKARQRQDNSKDYLSFLKKCIQQLNSQDRGLILLRYQQNLKVKDISVRFGKSVQSVYQNIARVQDLLLSCVQKAILLDHNR